MRQTFVYSLVECCLLFVASISVAQWIARRTSNPEVVGSSPTGDVFYFEEHSFENKWHLKLALTVHDMDRIFTCVEIM